MVRDIIKDTIFLSQKSQPAVLADLPLAQDLLDTLAAHQDHCVGLAANMIGISKCIIAIQAGPLRLAMLNPVISKTSASISSFVTARPSRILNSCLFTP